MMLNGPHHKMMKGNPFFQVEIDNDNANNERPWRKDRARRIRHAEPYHNAKMDYLLCLGNSVARWRHFICNGS